MAEKKEEKDGVNGDKQLAEQHDEYEYLNLVKKIIETGNISYACNVLKFPF